MGRFRYINAHVQNLRRTLWDVILWKIGFYDDPRTHSPAPQGFTYPGLAQLPTQGSSSALWIGHSSFLIKLEGLTILTDPVWDQYCSPVPIRSLKRLMEPSLLLSDLPPIDVVLISHNHYDHLDLKTIRVLHQLHPQALWVVPERLSSWFHKKGIRNVFELSWWQRCNVKNCIVTAVPSQHFSGRSLWDQNTTHWNGYVLQAGIKLLYFVGDTGYNPVDFKEIGRQFTKMDLSLIPIGTYAPKRFMQPVHIEPQEAVQIHLDVNSQLSLGMHWNTFRLSDEPQNRPPYDLYLAMKEKKLPFETFLPIDIGTCVPF